MAIDHKYGKVTLEHGNIGEDEPVVVFRAADLLLPKVLSYYHLFCLKKNTPKRHLDMIITSIDKIREWQKNHPTDVRIPNSENSRTWMSE